MKRVILAASLAMTTLIISAQDNPYIVKTKGVQKPKVTATSEAQGSESGSAQADEPQDFIGKNFRFVSLCDWQDGMKFMVRPEKYDLIVNTFRDAQTHKEVSSGRLRNKIMIYKYHTEGPDGHERLYFHCEDDNRDYYYAIPNGAFEDYCYGKLGVPTLAYLGDVDIARDKLIGKQLFTTATKYRIDTEYDGDGYQEITVEQNEEVTVTKVGVGTRRFPVKIIVEDKSGREFYQCVAISKTNCGMRDDEFIMDNAPFLFAGSFRLTDDNMAVSADYRQYLNKTIYTKYATSMESLGDGKMRTVKVPRLTEFIIDEMTPRHNSNYVRLRLRESETRRVYFKDVTFVNENVAGDIDGYKEDYFGYLFGVGAGKLQRTSLTTRTAIREGRVIVGMSEEEVELAVGVPDRTASSSNGRYDWIYKRTNSWLIVQFDKTGKVIGTKVQH